jgi:hypothetical protein
MNHKDLRALMLVIHYPSVWTRCQLPDIPMAIGLCMDGKIPERMPECEIMALALREVDAMLDVMKP